MKVSRIATAFVSVLLTLSCTGAVLADSLHSVLAVTSVAAVGQTVEDQASLLKQARAAMTAGQFAQAEATLKRAEATPSNLRWSFWADTPEKVRKDLDKKLATAQTAPPSQSRLPQTLNPFAQRPNTGSDPFERAGAAVSAPQDDRKQLATSLLQKGREALAHGDTNAAMYFHKQAADMQVAFGPNEDSPQKLAGAIHSAGQGFPNRTAQQVPTLGRPDSPFQALPAVGREPQLQAPPTANQIAQYPRTNSYIQQTPAAGEVRQAAGYESGQPGSAQAIYNPAQDSTQTQLASGVHNAGTHAHGGGVAFAGGSIEPFSQNRNADYIPNGSQNVTPASNGTSSVLRRPDVVAALPRQPRGNSQQAFELIELGKRARQQGNLDKARRYFQQAEQFSGQLDPQSRQKLQDLLQFQFASVPETTSRTGGLLQEAEASQLALAKKISSSIARNYQKAMKQQDKDAMGSLALLNQSRSQVETAALSDDHKKILLRRVDGYLVEMERYIEQNRPLIELDEHNRDQIAAVQRQRRHKVEVSERLALLVDEFNKLRGERRFAEAREKSKEAAEIAPNEPVVIMMRETVRVDYRLWNAADLREQHERGVDRGLGAIDESSIPYDDRNPILYQDRISWNLLTTSRNRFAGDRTRPKSPQELEIERKLTTPVSLSFRDAPLSQVIQHLRDLSAVNIYLDPQGMAEEGVDPSHPISIDLTTDISLKSALNLILSPLHLGYVIKNEVLKITSEQQREGEVYTNVYHVADLVIPIPNFVPHNRMGLAGALADGYENTLRSSPGGFSPSMMSVAASGSPMGMATPGGVLAQSPSSGFATGGAGGGSNADFDALIDLITQTIDDDTWLDAGGEGTIAEFETNLSLVVSQTQEVHEKIADLLKQLRRLQDLQVTIEVRFITLQDDFFERIGVDFQFNIDDNAGGSSVTDDGGPSTTVGWEGGFDEETGIPNLTSDLDLQFRQNSSGAALPPFAFAPAADPISTIGLAILSDIEVFLFLEAMQGDKRSNTLQAPKVTMFNGQTAQISDQSQTPFVVSVTPVVGDFAAAQSPVIVVLSSGTTLSVQAVVSSDRRYVRLTLVPFFSQVTDVSTFSFTGTTTSTNSSSSGEDDEGNTTNSANSASNLTQGTVLQLPTFQFTTVTTTVSVPDGGTVLLGGVKRLKEGRNEFGVPMVSKIPYLNRLFKNVGIGREAQSLMLMVTPRIIIQEEEEEKLGIAFDN